MKASGWESRNRALIFGLIFAFTFALYAVDHQNASAVLAEWLSIRIGSGADLLVRLLFAFAALLLVVCSRVPLCLDDGKKSCRSGSFDHRGTA
jgi:hypothetical protein